MSANSNSGRPLLERELAASVAYYMPRRAPDSATTRLAFFRVAAERHLPPVAAVTFAASVLAAVELGCDVREATRSVIAAWRIARAGDGALWPADVCATAVEASMVAAAEAVQP